MAEFHEFARLQFPTEFHLKLNFRGNDWRFSRQVWTCIAVERITDNRECTAPDCSDFYDKCKLGFSIKTYARAVRALHGLWTSLYLGSTKSSIDHEVLTGLPTSLCLCLCHYSENQAKNCIIHADATSSQLETAVYIMVDRGRWLGNFIKSIVLGFCVPCTRSRLKIILFSIIFEVFQYLFQIMTYFELCFQ